MGVGLDVAAVEGGYLPVKLALLVSLRLQGLKRLLPDALLGPAVEPGRAGSPRTVATGNVAPGCAGAKDPEDAVDDGAMVFVGIALFLCFLGWQQRFELLPLVIG